MEYSVVRKNIKNVYIQIKDGKVIVRVPRKIKEVEIEKLIKEKESWINKNLETQIQKNSEQSIELLGRKYSINVIPSNRDCIELTGDIANLYTLDYTKENKDKIINNLYKKYALKQYSTTLQKMMELTNLEPDSWRIRDIHSAWGSCSCKRTITLSLSLIKKREELIEYVVVHELCHLKHMNHSKDFWNLVGQYVPNYRECRRELKK